MDRRTLGVAAVVLVVVGMGAGLLFGALASGGIPAFAGPTPAPTEVVYTSKAFQPWLTVTVPSNWAVTTDTTDALEILPLIEGTNGSPVPSGDVASLSLFHDVRAALQDPACTTKPEPGVGADAKSLASWVAARPGLTATEPKAVTIGGLQGWEVEAWLAPTWSTSCPFANGTPSVSLLANDAGTVRWVAFGSEKLRLDFLDVPGGGTVTVNTSATDGSVFPGLSNEVAPIVASMKFAS